MIKVCLLFGFQLRSHFSFLISSYILRFCCVSLFCYCYNLFSSWLSIKTIRIGCSRYMYFWHVYFRHMYFHTFVWGAYWNRARDIKDQRTQDTIGGVLSEGRALTRIIHSKSYMKMQLIGSIRLRNVGSYLRKIRAHTP